MAKKMASSRAAKNGHDGVAWGYVCGRSGEDVGSLGRSHWESWWFRLPNEQKHGIQMAHSRERPCSLNAVSHIIPMPAIIYDIYVVHSNYQNYTYKKLYLHIHNRCFHHICGCSLRLCVDPLCGPQLACSRAGFLPRPAVPTKLERTTQEECLKRSWRERS